MKLKQREKVVIKTSIISIITNIMLSIFKAIVGLLSNSIAIVLDAVNNLSDAASGVITIVGTKLATKSPDKQHPYGHGRIEYLSELLISVIIIYAGATALFESVKKIITPELPDYKTISIVIVAVSIIVKIVLGLYVKKKGESVKSNSLVDSGKDALLDSVLSFSTLVAALIFILYDLSLEAYLGALISIYILKSGIEMIRGTLSQILGERAPRDIALSVKKTVNSFKEVKGTYDLFLNNYGPNIYIGSLHIEVDESLDAIKIDKLTREITEKVMIQNNVLLTAVGIYSLNTKDKVTFKMRKEVQEIVFNHDNIIGIHGFFVNKKEKTITFDLIIDFKEKDREKLYSIIYKEIKDKYKDYNINITLDLDVSD